MAGVETGLRNEYEKFSYDRHLTGFNLGRARVSSVSLFRRIAGSKDVGRQLSQLDIGMLGHKRDAAIT